MVMANNFSRSLAIGEMEDVGEKQDGAKAEEIVVSVSRNLSSSTNATRI
jgi:hypothetical protein